MKKEKVKITLLMFVAIICFIGIYYMYEEKKIDTKEEKIKEEKIDKISKEEIQLFDDYYEEAKEVLKNMTLEEKIGQLFLVRYDKNLVEQEKEYYPGGYILFAKDFENHNKTSIRKELDYVQEISKYPLIFAVDEEGGFVTRISRFTAFRESRFKSPKAYYEEGGYEKVEETEKEKAALLKELGLNLNLAPVADVSLNEEDFIYNRSFGEDATKTAEYIKKMVQIANESGINSCLKHFPGYGNNVDTHTGVAIDERSYENFLENDFLPFEAGIKENVPCVLVSHNVVKSIDEKYPSSLSEKVIHELRDTLNFSGVVITDDLAMDAVKAYVEDGKAATLAINAGNDMIITSDFITMRDEVYTSVQNKEIDEDTINKAVLRIIAWKYSSGLMEKSDIITKEEKI